MRFLVDECTGPAVAHWLAESGHEVFSVFDEVPGMSDTEVVRQVHEERRILITNDKTSEKKSTESSFHIVGLCSCASTMSEARIRLPCFGVC